MIRAKNSFFGAIIRQTIVVGLCVLGLSAQQVAIGASMPASRLTQLTPAQRAVLFGGVRNSKFGQIPDAASRPVRWQSRLVAPRFTGTTPEMLQRPSAATQGATPGTLDPERQKLREAGIKAELERREKIEKSSLPEWLASSIYRPTQAEIDWKVLRTPAEEAQQNRPALQQARRIGWQTSQAEQEDRIAAAQARAEYEQEGEELELIKQRIEAQEARSAIAGEREHQKQAGIQAVEERRMAIEQSKLPRWVAEAIYRPTQEELDWRVLRTDAEARKEAREARWRDSAKAREERIKAAQERAKKEEALVASGLATQRNKAEVARRIAAVERENQRLAAEKDALLRQQNLAESRLPRWAAWRVYGRPTQAEIDWMVTSDE